MVIIESNNSKQELDEQLNKLSGFLVSKVLRSIGTVLYFKLGSIRKGEEEKKYPKYEASILIELNNWKLLKNGELLLSDKEPEDVITEKVKKLEGEKFEKGRFIPESDFPMEFIFSSGYVLKVSDTWPPREWGLSIGLPDGNYVEIDKGFYWRKVSADHIK